MGALGVIHKIEVSQSCDVFGDVFRVQNISGCIVQGAKNEAFAAAFHNLPYLGFRDLVPRHGVFQNTGRFAGPKATSLIDEVCRRLVLRNTQTV